MAEEIWSTATYGLEFGVSFGFIRKFGFSDADIVGAGLSAVVYIANGFDPDDSLPAQMIDIAIPDEVGILITVTAADGLGVGGYLSKEFSLYPEMSPGDLVRSQITSLEIKGLGGGIGALLEGDDTLIGVSGSLGIGLGYFASVSGASIAIGINSELGFVFHTEEGTYATGLPWDQVENPALPMAAYDDAVRRAARQKLHEDRMEALSASNASGSGAGDSATDGPSGTSDAGGWDPAATDDTPGLDVGGANDQDLNGHEDTDNDNNTTWGGFVDTNNGWGEPVVLDLDGDGLELSLGSDASFDNDGDGYREETVWVAPDDGFLVMDLARDHETRQFAPKPVARAFSV